MSNTFDTLGLDRIQGDLDALLAKVHDGLEPGAADTIESSFLDETGRDLNSIRHSLESLGVFGAATLAQEIELLARRLAKGDIDAARQATEVLVLSLVRLEDYLKRLRHGQEDLPVVLLPFLNDLRSARDAHLLTEAAFFNPGFGNPAPRDDWSVDSEQANEALPALARTQRQVFQTGLVQWFRDPGSSSGLPQLRDVLQTLEQASGTDTCYKIFWTATAVVEALQNGSLQAGNAIKQLLGRLDGAIRLLIDQGESAMDMGSVGELLKNLLFYVAQIQPGDDRVRDIVRTFELEGALPSQADIEAHREQLCAPPADAMNAVTEALKSELTDIKTELDTYLRSGASRSESLPDLVAPLTTACDTLGMIGQADVALKLRDQLENISVSRPLGSTTRALA